MKKKIITLFLAITMIVSTFSACGNETKETKVASSTETSAKETENSASKTTETTVAEEIAYPEEISIFSTLGTRSSAAGMKDNNDTYWAQELERITGTHVVWEHVSSDTKAEKFNLMIASENYTDAIIYDWQNAEGGLEMYYEDGIIVDLTDLIPECMPNLNAYLDAHPDVRKILTNSDGQILYIPTIRDDLALNIFVGPQIRTDWLDKLGLDIPKTTDDLYEVLKAFKTKDPNGNGEADEIPMSGVSFTSNLYGVGNLLWAFDTHYSFYVKDGKVVWGPVEEQFTEGLAYIAKLYDEGLIDVDYLLNDRTAMDSKAIADRVGFEFSYQPTKYYNSADFNDGTKVMAGIPYLTTKDNDSMMCFNQSYTQGVVTSVSLAVTTACEDPKGLLKWLDTVYSEEGIIALNFGKEGTHFEYVNGQPQVIPNMSSELQADYYATTMIVNATFPLLQQWEAYSATLSEWGSEAIATWADGVDTSGILPSISLTTEEKDQIADALTQIQTYAETQMNNVVIGELSINEWPNVVKKFQDMGIDKVLEVYNAAYKRYISK